MPSTTAAQEISVTTPNAMFVKFNQYVEGSLTRITPFTSCSCTACATHVRKELYRRACRKIRFWCLYYRHRVMQRRKLALIPTSVRARRLLVGCAGEYLDLFTDCLEAARHGREEP